jgi:hypothetical protein
MYDYQRHRFPNMDGSVCVYLPLRLQQGWPEASCEPEAGNFIIAISLDQVRALPKPIQFFAVTLYAGVKDAEARNWYFNLRLVLRLKFSYMATHKRVGAGHSCRVEQNHHLGINGVNAEWRGLAWQSEDTLSPPLPSHNHPYTLNMDSLLLELIVACLAEHQLRKWIRSVFSAALFFSCRCCQR